MLLSVPRTDLVGLLASANGAMGVVPAVSFLLQGPTVHVPTTPCVADEHAQAQAPVDRATEGGETEGLADFIAGGLDEPNEGAAALAAEEDEHPAIKRQQQEELEN